MKGEIIASRVSFPYFFFFFYLPAGSVGVWLNLKREQTVKVPPVRWSDWFIVTPFAASDLDQVWCVFFYTAVRLLEPVCFDLVRSQSGSSGLPATPSFIGSVTRKLHRRGLWLCPNSEFGCLKVRNLRLLIFQVCPNSLNVETDSECLFKTHPRF